MSVASSMTAYRIVHEALTNVNLSEYFWVRMLHQPLPSTRIAGRKMPVIFTVMLAGFASGLVIYWAWNNLLSISQQSYIMHRQGADLHLFRNLKRHYGSVRSMLARKPAK